MGRYEFKIKPMAQDYKEIYHNTKKNYYVEGSGIVNMGGGIFVAAVPVVIKHCGFPPEDCGRLRAETSCANIVQSTDGGETWNVVSQLPYYSAVPWVHDGILYLFGNKGGREYRNDDLILLKSEDKGKTWSEPVTLFEGHFWNCHTGMAVCDNKLYWATDDLSFGDFRGPRVVVCDLNGDIMERKSWRISNPVPFIGVPDTLKNSKLVNHHKNALYLEPNVICVNGRIRVLAALKIQGQSATGMTAVFDAEDDGKNVTLSFTQFHSLPGGQVKFFITYDEKTGMYWSACNLPADGQDEFLWKTHDEDISWKHEERFFFSGNDRRILMLMYSLDGLNWFHAGCIAKADRLKQSFMYPAIAIDGDDLCVIARSSKNGENRHDADYATFHRIKNFRDLAMDLVPVDEEYK